MTNKINLVINLSIFAFLIYLAVSVKQLQDKVFPDPNIMISLTIMESKTGVGIQHQTILKQRLRNGNRRTGESIMDELDNILSNIDLEEEKNEVKEEYVDDWYCMDCEHGPMNESDDKCTRCGAKNSQYHGEEEITGWEDEDIESEVEEIW